MSLVNGLVISSFMSLGFDITPHLFRKTFDTIFFLSCYFARLSSKN